MGKTPDKKKSCLSSYEFEAGSLSVQDALIILAIRIVGDEIRRSPSARQHILALARATPLFRMEDYAETEGRFNRFVNWAGTTTMDDLFIRALEKLRGAYRGEALAWSAINAVTQQPTEEMAAMLHHIGDALDFSASEVETMLSQAQRKPFEKGGPDDETGG